ncbi:MAG TPA: ATP-binding protein [Burkholderiales bacterium]|nr:ATP-binding protein [Burkholderiales bacterium]
MNAPVNAYSNLRRLFFLRGIAVGGEILAIAAAVGLFGTPLPLTAMGAIIMLQAAVNVRTWMRLRRAAPVSEAELFLELLADVAALTALLYLSGGSTNPFVSLYLLPLTIAATAFSARYAWAMAGLTIACYSALMFFYVPLGQGHEMHSSAFNLHVLGMWANFLVSAVLIASFVATMSASIRGRDRELAIARERALRDEQVVALGTFAAGAAHELGTPLSTIAVIARELERQYAADPSLRDDLHLLRTQVDNCKRIITSMTTAAGLARAGQAKRQSVEEFLAGVAEKWALIRPQVRLSLRCGGTGSAPQIVGEETVRQTLINILNNAADASPQAVEIEGTWNAAELTIEVRDRGPGITDDIAEKAGRAFFSTKAAGRGIGLFLANATIERLGGNVALFNRDDGGGCTRVTIPLARLAADA